MGDKWILIGAGDLTVSEIPLGEGDIVVAVDGGLEYCEILGLTPDYIIGDFDSLQEEKAAAMEELSAKDEKIILLPKEKDDTDMMAAIKLGLSKGAKMFQIYAAMGGRLEHSLSNIQGLLYLKNHGSVGYLMDGTGMILAAKEEEISFREEMEGYISVLSLCKNSVITLENLKYNLHKKEITNDFPLGVSNEFIYGKRAKITVHQGEVVIIVNFAE